MSSWLAIAGYVAIAAMWLVPDRRLAAGEVEEDAATAERVEESAERSATPRPGGDGAGGR